MINGILLSSFQKGTKGRNERDGERVFNNDLVITPEVKINENEVHIFGKVISESLYNEYETNIFLNFKGELTRPPLCTCEDFEKKGEKQRNYGCKHINAQFLYFLSMMDRDDELYSLFTPTKQEQKVESNSFFELLDALAPKEKKDEIKFEVYINKRDFDRSTYVNFKIGLKSMKSNALYTLKDIDAFLTYLHNNVPLKYGKDFTFDPQSQVFTGDNLNILNMIKTIKAMDSSSSFKRSQDRLINGKNMFIPKAMIRGFLESLENHRLYLEEGFFYRPVESEVIKGEIPIPFMLKEGGESILLEITGAIPKELNENGDVFIYNGSIYIPPYSQIETLTPYLKFYNEAKGIQFPIEYEEEFLRRVIPSLQKISKDVTLSKRLKERVVISPPKFKFYFDRENEIKLTFNVDYDGYEFNYFSDPKDKIIFRDKRGEEKIFNKLRDLGFVEFEDKFIFFKDEDYVFSFFMNEIEELLEIGEVFYSENFKGIVKVNTGSMDVNVRKGKHDYFDFEFNIEKISDEEFRKILRAFRNNKKYYKLESGEFINLEEIELKKLLVLLSNSTDENLEGFNMPYYKAPYFTEYVDKYNLNYFTGLTALRKVIKAFENYKDLDIEVPKNLNAELRNYQLEGFKWLKVLKKCNYGGLLGDEMGLGKTLQMITFLLSEENSNSLIVAPTSLIYNWESEFKKFAPSMKVALVNDDKEKREEIISNYRDYDVLITTYNLQRMDKELYEMCIFDNVIIDEAQNIKNSSSQSAISVKEIKGNNKFALTGTPIENSLMELWSIFDFIMPEYLYDKKQFETRYFRRLEEEDFILKEVKALINPFILRRRKKNVINELPDKIEKRITVKMTKEQEAAYGAYSTYIKELIAKKVQDDEFSKNKIEILSYITKLRQLALDPSIVMEDYDGGSGKIDGVIEILNECREEGHKVLLFSQFTSALKNLSKECTKNHISFSYLDGSTPSKKRIELVNSFNNDDTNVFLISLKAGGAGLNLTSADVVIHLDPWWNPAVEDQATDRAHRIGQENVVEVIKLVSKDTIEEKVINLQDKKKEIIELVLEDNDFENMVSSLSDEDIMHLIE